MLHIAALGPNDLLGDLELLIVLNLDVIPTGEFRAAHAVRLNLNLLKFQLKNPKKLKLRVFGCF